MINISYKLNKKINTHVFFADENFNFLANSSSLLTNNAKNISLFKEEYKDSKKVSINVFESGIKHQIYIFKIKSNASDYDYQKLGGNVLDSICRFENVNLFLESSNLIKKNYNNFIKNFFYDYFQKIIIF